MRKERVDQIVTALFGVLLLLQLVKWGSMQLPVQGPLALMLATGLVVGLTPKAWAFRNRALFLLSYSCGFLLLWAVGHPQAEMEPGKLWGLTLVTCMAVAGSIVWNSKVSGGKVWLLAIGSSVLFGLMIAFISGPRGGPDWMQKFLMDLWHTDDWQYVNGVVYNIRKTMHFCGYGLAALCTAIAANKAGAGLKTSFWLGLAWPVPLAVFDEWQQTATKTRTGKFTDVLLDTAGMLVFLGLWFWAASRRETKQAIEAKL